MKLHTLEEAMYTMNHLCGWGETHIMEEVWVNFINLTVKKINNIEGIPFSDWKNMTL